MEATIEPACRTTPNVQWNQLKIGASEVYVVREDLLEGGTKERGAVPYIAYLQNEGYREFIYASPFAGFAQVALAKACCRLQVYCTLFVVKDPGALGKQPHAYTRLAELAGAKIHLTESLEEAEDLSSRYLRQNSAQKAFKIPLGFDDPVFRDFFEQSLQKQWNHLMRELPCSPRNVWVSLGSGTLSGILRKILPVSVGLHVMDVHVLKPSDPRIQHVRQRSNVHYHSAVQEFAEPESELPPVPSNHYYDAKVWKTFAKNAQSGDLWWNVAR